MRFFHVFELPSVFWCAEDCLQFSSLSFNVFTVVTDTLQYISVLSSACAEGINANTHASCIQVCHKASRMWSKSYTRIHNFCNVKKYYKNFTKPYSTSSVHTKNSSTEEKECAFEYFLKTTFCLFIRKECQTFICFRLLL
jgi:hypothetical protein